MKLSINYNYNNFELLIVAFANGKFKFSICAKLLTHVFPLQVNN